MEEKVKLIDLECLPYKQTGTSTVKGTDEIQQILDDQLNLLIMMKASPAAKEKQIEKQVKMIEQKIVWIQDTLDYMIKVQRGWMYLEPIFASDDIKKKMPNEKGKFDTIDSNWRQIMAKFTAEKNLWEGIESDRMK